MSDPRPTEALRSGARLLVEALAAHGADTVFCVPGESYLAVLDSLYDVQDRVKLYVCRHEGGASNMAEAYGKLTGRPGVCIVTRGPGATNASIGVHTAFQDSTPMILLVGQVPRWMMERECFQEVEYRKMFAPLAKWVAQIDSADRIPEFMSHAFHVAVSGRPGPVVLALPEDVLSELSTARSTPRYRRVEAHPGADNLRAVQRLLSEAQRPMVVLGGSGWNAEACESFRRFVHANDLPVGCAFRFQDLFDNRDPHYVGDVGIGINPKLAQRVKDADLLLVIGARLGEMTTSGYTLLSVPRPAQRLVHVHAGAEELGRVYQGDVLINASMPAIASALAELEPVRQRPWGEWARAGRADFDEWCARRQIPGPVQLWDVMEFLGQRLPEDTILTNGAGNYSAWVHRFYRYPRFRTQVAPTSGAMGYGVPAAVAAKIVHPDRMVVCFAGDGCFLMTGQELATAVQYQLPVLFIVLNNGMYGTIRAHQERRFPGRVIGTDLVNPDFAAYARAFGAHGELVTRTEEFAPAFERAVASRKPAVIEVRVDPQAITPNTTIDAMRAAALGKR